MIEFKGKLKNETRVKIKNNETLLNRLLGGSESICEESLSVLKTKLK